jgi:hypothetical protein
MPSAIDCGRSERGLRYVVRCASGSRATAIKRTTLGKITRSGVASSRSRSSCETPNGFPYLSRGPDTFSEGGTYDTAEGDGRRLW